MKKSGKGLVMSILASVFAVLTFIGLAFKFLAVTTSISGQSGSSASATLSEWIEFVNDGVEAKADGFGWYQFAYALMIITLIVVGVILILTVVQLFIENKILEKVLKYVSIAGIVVSIAFIVIFLVACIIVSDKASFTNYSVNYLPNLGSIWLFLCGMLASIFGLVINKKKKEKKNKE